MSGNRYFFMGDRALQVAGQMRNFHIKPARIAYRLSGSLNAFPGKRVEPFFYQVDHTRFALIDRPVSFLQTTKHELWKNLCSFFTAVCL